MKAIVQDRYGSADVLELADIDKPAPQDNELLVRVHAAGVDPSVWHLMTGLPYMVRPGVGLRKPRARVRGWDLAGRVEAVGAKVTDFRPGDEVFGSGRGAFAEYACVREDKCAPKPAGLAFEQAAAITTSAVTALQALRDKGHVQQGQHVLVIGAGGGVGTFAVQLAKAFGAEVTGVCSTAKTDLVRSIGADHVIDYTREDFADGTRHYDLVVDAAGLRSLSHLRRALTPRGTAVLVGGEGGGNWFGDMDRSLAALTLSPFRSRKVRWLIAMTGRAELRLLAELVEAGRVTPALDRTFPLSEAAEAVRYVQAGRARGKVVLSV